MFDNIGKKLKGLAEVMCVLGIIGSIITGIVIIVNARVNVYSGYYGYETKWSGTLLTVGITVIIVGSIFSWIVSCMIYAVGQIADGVESNSLKLAHIQTIIDKKEKQERHGIYTPGKTVEINKVVPKNWGFDTTELKDILTEASATLDETVRKKELRNKRNELERLGKHEESDVLHEILNSGDIPGSIEKVLREMG